MRVLNERELNRYTLMELHIPKRKRPAGAKKADAKTNDGETADVEMAVANADDADSAQLPLVELVQQCNKAGDYAPLRTAKDMPGAAALYATSWDWHSTTKSKNAARDMLPVVAAAIEETKVVERYRKTLIDAKVHRLRKQLGRLLNHTLAQPAASKDPNAPPLPPVTWSWWDGITYEGPANDDAAESDDSDRSKNSDDEHTRNGRNWLAKKKWPEGQARLETARAADRDHKWMQSMVDEISRNEATHGSTSTRGEYVVDEDVHKNLFVLMQVRAVRWAGIWLLLTARNSRSTTTPRVDAIVKSGDSLMRHGNTKRGRSASSSTTKRRLTWRRRDVRG